MFKIQVLITFQVRSVRSPPCQLILLKIYQTNAQNKNFVFITGRVLKSPGLLKVSGMEQKICNEICNLSGFRKTLINSGALREGPGWATIFSPDV